MQKDEDQLEYFCCTYQKLSLEEAEEFTGKMKKLMAEKEDEDTTKTRDNRNPHSIGFPYGKIEDSFPILSLR